MITGFIRKAVKKAPLDLYEGCRELLTENKKLAEFAESAMDWWDDLEPEDRERFIGLARLAADIALKKQVKITKEF